MTALLLSLAKGSLAGACEEAIRNRLETNFILSRNGTFATNSNAGILILRDCLASRGMHAKVINSLFIFPR